MTDSRREHQDVRIGTLVPPSRPADYLQQILPHGFESFELVFDPAMAADLDLGSLAESIRQVLDRSPAPATISCLGIYGNPLTSAEVEQNWHRLVAACPDFGCDLVCGFTGRLVDRPVPESIPRFAEVFGRLADRAGEQGVRLAFENCDMGGDWDRGDWNIAHAPAAWELMFDAVDVPNLGLEWEPCHQMISLVDPLGQLHEWAERVFHVHGKDATILWDVIRRRGLRGGEGYVHHRTPGFGDTDWTDVISTLRLGGFRGSIDIEGWHDPVYRDDLEMTGQVRALAYLKQCRGGPFVPNPQMDDDGR